MSKQRSLRKSKISFDDVEEDEDGGVGVPPACLRAAQQRREKEKKLAEKTSLLSFDDDVGGSDEASARPAPKQNAKGRIGLRAPVPAALSAPQDGSHTQVSRQGEYTAERLAELRKGSRRPPGSGPAPAAGTFKLSGSFKAAVPPKDDRFQHTVAAVGLVAPGTMPLPPPPRSPGPTPADRDAASPAAPAEEQGGGDDAATAELEDDETIPDQQMISWVKAKRERLRSAHLAPDYIPTAALPVGPGRLPGVRGSHPAGRLQGGTDAEDGGPAGSGSDGDAEPEDALRLQFMSSRGGQGRARQGGLAREVEDAGEMDEEEAAWAEEQIRKGMGSGTLRGPPASAPRKPKAGLPSQTGGQEGVDPGQAGRGRAPTSGASAASASQAASVAAAADEVMAALQGALQQVQMTQRQAERNLERTQRSLEACSAGMTRVEEDLQKAGEKYTYAQRMRAYLADLCAMLADKSPLVEELEEELGRLQRERATAHGALRADEDAEAGGAAAAAVAAAVAALTRGDGDDAAAAAAAAAARAEEERLLGGGHLPVELDEFGRDSNAARRAKAAARARRRAQRLAELQPRFDRPSPSAAASLPPWQEPSLGDVTTDESEDEVAGFRSRRGEIAQAAAAVFRDADEEFASVGAVKTALEGWKVSYPGQYHDAYVGLSAPALFAPFVRLELLRWAPFEAATDTDGGPNGMASAASGDLRANGNGTSSGDLPSSLGATLSLVASFEQLQWYPLLFNYGMPGEGGAHVVDPGDPDADLLPKLLRNLALPLADRLLREVWRPHSVRQSVAAAAMLSELQVYLPPDDERLRQLEHAALTRLEEAAAAAALPAWPPAALAVSSQAEVHLAMRFGRALRVLRSVAAFKEALPGSAVRDIALERMVGGVMLPHVRAAAADLATLGARAQRVVAALPPEWLGGGGSGGLRALVQLVGAMVRPLEARAADPTSRAAWARVAQQFVGVLRALGDAENSRRLALMFNVA